jgi:hypothetical protein
MVVQLACEQNQMLLDVAQWVGTKSRWKMPAGYHQTYHLLWIILGNIQMNKMFALLLMEVYALRNIFM